MKTKSALALVTFALAVSGACARSLSPIDRATLRYELASEVYNAEFHAYYLASSATETAFDRGQAQGIYIASLAPEHENDTARLVTQYEAQAAFALLWGELNAVTATERAYWRGMAVGFMIARQLAQNLQFAWTFPGASDDDSSGS